MFSLLGMVAAATTTAVGAFSEGLVTSILLYSVAKGTGKTNLNFKK